MQIFDFNIHLPVLKEEDVNKTISEDLNLDVEGLINNFSHYSQQVKDNVGANFMLFNKNLFDNAEKFGLFRRNLKDVFQYFSFTSLIDFRRNDIFEYLEKAKSYGLDFVMVNSYLQQILDSEFELVYKVFKYAEDHKIKICIDASYGTSKMYTYDNLKLACYIADRITKVPIVIIHSGGKRILEAMWLAIDKPNIIMDTSFSLPYYIGSSVEQDIAFAYRNIGISRVVYGSDFPYENSTKAQEIHIRFFEKYGFSSTEIEGVMLNNAINLISDV